MTIYQGTAGDPKQLSHSAKKGGCRIVDDMFYCGDQCSECDYDI